MESNLAHGVYSSHIELREVSTLRRTATLQTDDTTALPTFSPDGSHLAVAVGVGQPSGGVRIFDLSSHKPPVVVNTGEQVQQIVFSPDGRRLATADGPGEKAQLWDAVSGQEITTEPFATFGGWTNGVAFNHDGSLVAATGDDGEVILADGHSGRRLGTFTGVRRRPGGVWPAVEWLQVAFDGRTGQVVQFRDDGVTVAWDISAESWSTRACAVAGRNLTHVEWATYFPDRPYDATCPGHPPAS